MNKDALDEELPKAVDLEKHKSEKGDSRALYPTANPSTTYKLRSAATSDSTDSWKESALAKKPVKQRRVGKVALLVAGIVLILSIVYLFFIRVSDTEYQKAVATVDTMINDVKKISDERSVASLLLSTEYSSHEISNTKKLAAEYNEQLEEFKQLAAFTRDAQVQVTYEEGKERIEGFATRAKNVAAAYMAVEAVMKNCTVFTSTNWMSVQSSQEFDAMFKDCSEYLQLTTTIEPTSINDSFYKPYRKGLIDYIEAMRLYAVADKKSTSQLATVSARITENAKKMEAISETLQFSSADDPKTALESLKSLLNQRKSTFIR